jgi:hypothetical protein
MRTLSLVKWRYLGFNEGKPYDIIRIFGSCIRLNINDSHDFLAVHKALFKVMFESIKKVVTMHCFHSSVILIYFYF